MAAVKPRHGYGADAVNRSGNPTPVVVCVLVVIVTAAFLPLTGSLVLCVGSDGHADLEVAFDACCVEDHRGDHDPKSPVGLVDSCGSCSDLDLDSTPLTKQRQRLEAPPDSVAVQFTRVEVCVSLLVIDDAESDVDRPDLEDLSSVVLLT
jgi:hypothetical protein